MSEPPAFEVVRPTVRRVPVVAHLPHASTYLPATVREEIVLGDDELALELLRLTDWYTDELFAWLTNHGVTLFVNRRSRLVFDPERFLDDGAESMAASGQGVVYWRGTQGQRMREPDEALRARRVQECYRPYHAALDTLVAEELEASGVCTLIDCHSFPSLPLPSEIDHSLDRPDICIGTDAIHTPMDLADAMEAAFAAEGFGVKRDSPFAGAFVPSGYHASDRRVRAVMIEVRRDLYMDEASGDRRAAFAMVGAKLERAALASGVLAG